MPSRQMPILNKKQQLAFGLPTEHNNNRYMYRGSTALASTNMSRPSRDLMASLWRGWGAVFPGAHKTALTPFVDQLAAAYNEPHRTYHNLEHVADVVEKILAYSGRLRSQRHVVWALLWHDAVYDPRSGSNEADSVSLAARVADELRASGIGDAPDLDETRRLIMLTCHSAVGPDPLVDPDGAALIDVDLSVLGALPERFLRYDADIRVEYAHVPEAAFISGRLAVLRSFLSRDKIFLTDEFHSRLEGQARENLRAAISLLEEKGRAQSTT